MYDQRMIAVSYLNSWFVPDLLSIFPFEELLKGTEAALEDRNLASFRLLRLIRLAKLMKARDFSSPSDIICFSASASH